MSQPVEPPVTPPELPTVAGMTVLRRLGGGSTAQVYAARRDLDGWGCALKILACGDPALARQARREAVVLSGVASPHLVRVHDVVDAPHGQLALVLDLADGGTVAGVVAQRGRLEPGEVVTVLAPVLGALAELHGRGVTHGDVSAGNVLFTRDGRPMLSDLGAARLVGERLSEVAVTAGYAAPELLAGEQPGSGTDVYAAGAVGWFALTGSPAPPGVFRPPLAHVAPQTPQELAAVIEDCLRGDPAARPDAAAAESRVLASTPPRPVTLPDGPDPADQLTMRLRRDPPQARREAAASVGARHRRPAPARWAPRWGWVALAAASAALAGGGWAAWGSRADSPAPSVAASVSTPTLSPGRAALAPAALAPAASSAGPSPAEPYPQVSRQTAAVAAVRELVARRAVAFQRADPGLLAAVYLPGSAPLARDQADLRALRAAGARYEGLTYPVREATLLSATAELVMVRARIDTGRYVAVRPGGARAPVAGARGPALRLTLRRAGRDWRIAAIQAA